MPDPKPATDLSLATIDELLDELKQRHTGLVVIRDRPAKTDEEYHMALDWHGASIAHVLGLIEYGRKRLRARIDDYVDADLEEET